MTVAGGIAQVLEPPFVNSGIVALHGELMVPELLRTFVEEALNDPQNSSREQTIVVIAVKLGREVFPDKLSLVKFDDVHTFSPRNMKDEGFYSRHYVNWMRHLLYRDALKLRFERLSSSRGRGLRQQRSSVQLRKLEAR